MDFSAVSVFSTVRMASRFESMSESEKLDFYNAFLDGPTNIGNNDAEIILLSIKKYGNISSLGEFSEEDEKKLNKSEDDLINNINDDNFFVVQVLDNITKSNGRINYCDVLKQVMLSPSIGGCAAREILLHVRAPYDNIDEATYDDIESYKKLLNSMFNEEQ